MISLHPALHGKWNWIAGAYLMKERSKWLGWKNMHGNWCSDLVRHHSMRITPRGDKTGMVLIHNDLNS
ncbi:hypothetical protein EV130_112148 [Rhizobium azibense]|uniref:Uncharacterized protein n=1 Tax=Rhizobium azibense TaxID=1136135 RepID=A0A4R3RJ25_9HYPH|nr:hypothetical protein EV130_112148 [Rhizobium azibense]TCU35151.1 hypothetical protein EV129_110147 [Rhizobium azibense]